MIGAALGYNDLNVIVAVFDSQETAERLLVEWGCEWKYGRTKRYLATTAKFAEHFSALGFSMYSCGADFSEGMSFRFLPVTLNEPCSGYNDD